ncbi:BTAD domain-containing putative transcriptional regulator [Streptomyces sp. NPDC057638]|uniref:AfsR/SARP family transcriptional regulator n=1 Tax=Streptomyces sp. NPDC057638 TaxID=3346190 RepID=UPI00367A61B8
MRFSLLGPTRAHHDDGTPVALGGARLRALLTVLALRPGRAVPVGVLVDEVWGADPPADAVAALQALVGRLRRTLGPGVVDSADGGYRLAADRRDVDAHRFDQGVREGARALDDGDPARALTLLDTALALWHGPVLVDLPGHTAEAARWESRHRDARRTRLAALLALGRPEEVLPELAALRDEYALDEPLTALHLRALRAADRPAEALAAYDDFRRALADRLGADPGPALRTLHAELLAEPAEHPPAQRPPAEPADRAHRAESAHRAERPGQRTSPPTAPTSAPAPGGNLPARLTSFVGRESDITTLRDDLRTARLVTLLGPGGAGKTRLSLEVAEAAADGYPDGLWLAELAPVEDPADVPEAVLTALGARQTVLHGTLTEEVRGAHDPLVRLADHCGSRRMLLVLDNCEHVVTAAAALTEALLTRCPGLTVLATSREPLAVPGELLRPVDPLPDPVALRLLGERGAAALRGFRTEDDPGACAEICRRLDGLPLAIELAAARLRMLTPRQIADRLDDRFRLLTSGVRTVLPRQQTLRAVVDWSWELLDEDERTVLRQLSVFAGGCDLPAAEAVCGGDRVADRLGSLIDRSLVVAAPDDGGAMRYRLLETVAEYAAERLDEAGERDAVIRRHLVHYREFARTGDPLLRGPEQRAALARFQREYENLRAALRHAIAARDEQEALHLVVSLFWYWQLRDLRGEARHWSGQVCALGPDAFGPDATPAPPVPERFTDHPPPMPPHVLAEARRACALIRLVFTDADMGEGPPEEIFARMRRVGEIYRPGLPQNCRPPGTLWFYPLLLGGDGSEVRAMLDANLETAREHDYAWELAFALQSRALVLSNRASCSEMAITDADEALEIFLRLGDAWGASQALSARGETRERRGEYALAVADFTAALAQAERVGARILESVLSARLGGSLIELGETERGEALLREVLADQAGRVNEPIALARIFLAFWLARTGRYDEGRAQVLLVREQFQSSTLTLFEGMVVGYLALADLCEGHYTSALTHARQALFHAREELSLVVAPQMVSIHLVTLSGALAGAHPDQATTAARLLGVADTQRPEFYLPLAYERESRAAREVTLRDLLGDTAYETAHREGTTLSLDAVLPGL